MTVDDKFSWLPHTLELKKRFANKLNILKRSRFLPRNTLKDLYFKVILSSIECSIVMWGGCNNSDAFSSLERLHCRTAKIIFNLPRDMAFAEVLELAQWPTLHSHYYIRCFQHIHKAFDDRLPEILRSRIINRNLVPRSQPCFQALSSPERKTLVGSGHVPPRF